MTIALIIISSLLVAGGQILLKGALVSSVIVVDKNVGQMFTALIKGIFTPHALAALCVAGMGSAIYFLALRLGSVSWVVPATAGLIIAFTTLISVAVLKEP